MSRFKLRALSGVCALAGAVGLAGSGHAETYIYGGGSSLLAPYWTQAIACWSTDASVNQTAHGLYAKPASISAPQATFAAVTAPTLSPTACSPASQTYSVNYDSTGSGTGQLGVFAHDAVIGTNLTASGATQSTSGVLFGSGNAAGTTELFPSIQYGLSDNSLVNTDVGVYSVGTGASYTPPDGSGTITTAASYQGSTFTSTGTAHNGGTNSTVYPIPKTLYGPLVQFPVSIDPVALAYNPKYVSSNGNTYSLQIKTKNSDGSGGLPLNDAAICSIFTGAITDWGNSTLTTLNGGQSLKDPSDTGTSAKITIVGRTDSSGTTSIFTRHLAAVCTGSAAVFGSAGTTTLPTAVTGLSNFKGGSGSGGVASAINTNIGAIGYLGPDYALPAATKTGTNTYGLNVADLTNATNGTAYEPTGPNALTAFNATPGTGQTGSSSPPSTAATIEDPTKWVQGTAKTVYLANPAVGYPIVGTTNYIGYTCYASASSISALQNFFAFVGKSTVGSPPKSSQSNEILTNASLSLLPNNWLMAIANDFIAPNSTTSAYNTFFALKGTGKDGLSDGFTNSNCTPTTIVGG